MVASNCATSLTPALWKSDGMVTSVGREPLSTTTFEFKGWDPGGTTLDMVRHQTKRGTI